MIRLTTMRPSLPRVRGLAAAALLFVLAVSVTWSANAGSSVAATTSRPATASVYSYDSSRQL